MDISSNDSSGNKPVRKKRKTKALKELDNPLPGYDNLYEDIAKLTKEKIALCEIIQEYTRLTLEKHLLSHGWLEEEFQNYRLGFIVRVHRPLLKYDVVGLNGYGELIVESRRTILVHQLRWEHLDAETIRECFLEFEAAFLLAYDSPDGENYL